MDSGTIVDFGSAKPAFGNPDAVAEYHSAVEIRGWWEQKNGKSPMAVKGLMGDGVPYADSTADALIDYICVSHYMIGRQKPGVDGYDYWLANKYREAEELKQQKKYKELYRMFENYWQRFQVAAYTLIRMYIPPDSDETPETLVAEDATNPFELADGLLDWFPLSELQKMGMLGLAIMPPDTPATIMVHDINIKRIKIAQNEKAHLDAVRGRWEAEGINVIPGVTSSGRTQELVKLHEQFIAAQAEQNAQREAVLAAWRQKNDEAAANQARADNAEDVARRAAAEAQAQAERAAQAEAQVGNLLAEGNQLIGVQVARAANAENIAAEKAAEAAANAQRAAEAENKVNQLLQAGKQEIGNLVKQKEVLVDNYQLLQQRMADHIARAQKEKAALEEQNRARLQYAEAKHKIVLERVQNEIMAKYEAELKKELERIRELEARVIECDANKAQMQAELMQLAGDKNALLDDYKQLQQKMATPVTPAPAAEPAAAPDTATLPVAASAPPATTAITPAAPAPAVALAEAPVAAPVATTAAPVSPASATAPSLDSITVGGKTYTKADIESMQRVQVESDKWARHWIEKQKAQKKADAWWAKHPGAEKRDKAVKAKTVVKYASEYVPGKNDFLGVDTAKSSGRARKVKFI